MCLACSASDSPRAVDRVLTDIVCALELPAFEIVSFQTFDCADLLANKNKKLINIPVCKFDAIGDVPKIIIYR